MNKRGKKLVINIAGFIISGLMIFYLGSMLFAMLKWANSFPACLF